MPSQEEFDTIKLELSAAMSRATRLDSVAEQQKTQIEGLEAEVDRLDNLIKTMSNEDERNRYFLDTIRELQRTHAEDLVHRVHRIRDSLVAAITSQVYNHLITDSLP